jgi:hypothetical protein
VFVTGKFFELVGCMYAFHFSLMILNQTNALAYFATASFSMKKIKHWESQKHSNLFCQRITDEEKDKILGQTKALAYFAMASFRMKKIKHWDQ